ncbi:MAG: hypothetical protein ACREQ7_14230 [Candidatus Binatia bacterium]
MPEGRLVTQTALFRRAEIADYPAILRLQSANYIHKLAADERQQGFLSAEFSPEQVAALAQDLGTTLAVVADEVAGFLCAFRREFNHGSPVIAKMLECYDQVEFEGRPLSVLKSYIYGPVCVAREYRGRGLLRGLYEAQRRDLAGQFDMGVAFVSRDNPHSLRAHTSGIAMKEVGDFELGDNTYVILVFQLPPDVKGQGSG